MDPVCNWEASQNEFDRSRSIFERALDVDPRSVQLWLSYTEMELKSRNVQHARNLFDRAVTLLPRVDQLWYKYVYLEELLQNVPGARQVFERWMQWEPDDKAWQAYIKMEERREAGPEVWVKWAKFEEERSKLDKAREVFQTALQFFGDEEEQVEKAQAVFNAFAKMETRLKEYERARVIYKFALSRLPRSKSANLYAAYTKFEKQHGTRSIDGRNYDVWFDYVRLEEGALRTLREEGGTKEEEDAAWSACVTCTSVLLHMYLLDKKASLETLYLPLAEYALFEEIETKDYDRARQFTFAKLWIMAARFEIRQLDLMAARKTLGTAIGMCPKESLFKGYIQLEMDLREFDRVRTLYEKYLEYDPTNSAAWIKYVNSRRLEDFTRAEAIFELGVSQASLSMPEILWKAYIDFEVDEQGDREKTRTLTSVLWFSVDTQGVDILCEFEGSSIPLPRALREEEEDEDAEPRVVAGDPEMARQVFERGYKDLKVKGLKAE
ncbi:hypothetical protein EDB19DRAFT_1946632, partial [Suillus lakei]